MSNIEELTKEVLDLDNEQLNYLLDSIKKQKTEKRVEKIEKRLEENKALVGKCFKIQNGNHTYKYLTIIRSKSLNEYSFECLTFNSPFVFDERESSDSIEPKKHMFGSINFIFFRTESVKMYVSFCDENNKKEIVFDTRYEEIESDEFWKEAARQFNRLKKKALENEFENYM